MKSIIQSLILSVSFMLLGTTLYAGDSLRTPFTSTYKNDIGIVLNTRILRFSGLNKKKINPYQITYRRFFGANALRVKGGIVFSGQKNTTEDNITFSKGYFGYKIGVGYERYVHISKTFNFYFGGELNYYYIRNKSVNNTPFQKTTTLKYNHSPGLSTFAGLEVNLAKRVSISLEMVYSINSGFKKEKQIVENSLNNSESITKTSNFLKQDFKLPTVFTLRYKF